MQKNLLYFPPLCLLIISLFQGCATYTPSPPTSTPTKKTYPKPVIQQPQDKSPEPVQIAAAKSSKKSIGDKFIQSARKQVAAGQYQKAAATLERGLRLAPKESRLWTELASLKLLQGNFSQAIALAEKSNTLAKGNSKVIQKNSSIITKAQAKSKAD